MKEISVAENKQIQLELLKCFIEYCNQHQLTYYVAYGTLIGAIRHHGFIPWDDDIDVQMPREDYEKLIKTFNMHQKIDRYYLVSPYDNNALHTYVKIIDKRTVKIESGVKYKGDYLGIDIDVFPIDGMPSQKTEYDSLYKKMKKIYKKIAYSKIKVNGKSIKDFLLRLYQVSIGDSRHLLKKAENILKKHSFEKSDYVGTLISYDDYYNDYHRKEDFNNCSIATFEGIDVKVPIGYDRILTKIYGDYMKLPPIKKQVTHHSYSVYWRETT